MAYVKAETVKVYFAADTSLFRESAEECEQAFIDLGDFLRDFRVYRRAERTTSPDVTHGMTIAELLPESEQYASCPILGGTSPLPSKKNDSDLK